MALLPLILAVVSIGVALGAAALLRQAWQPSVFVQYITMIGLAVGIGYSLLILSRYREWQSQVLEKSEAIEGVGRTVFFSSMTVVLALPGMVLTSYNTFTSMGMGASLVAIAEILASLTLPPASLRFLGTWKWYPAFGFGLAARLPSGG